MLWTPSNNHNFEVKSYYKALQTGEPCPFSYKSVWKAKAPPHMTFFIWTAALGGIVLVDNLKRRRFTLVNWCCLCKNNEKIVNLLLIYCEYTSDL
jgi:hypothetical protein